MLPFSFGARIEVGGLVLWEEEGMEFGVGECYAGTWIEWLLGKRGETDAAAISKHEEFARCNDAVDVTDWSGGLSALRC